MVIRRPLEQLIGLAQLQFIGPGFLLWRATYLILRLTCRIAGEELRDAMCWAIGRELRELC